MLRVLIVDPEPSGRATIRADLPVGQMVEAIIECADYTQAARIIREAAPMQLAFIRWDTDPVAAFQLIRDLQINRQELRIAICSATLTIEESRQLADFTISLPFPPGELHAVCRQCLTAPKSPSVPPTNLPPLPGALDTPLPERGVSELAMPVRRVGRFGPGDVLAGRYYLVSRVGVGGMGEVYRADDLQLGQTVALKVLPEHLAADPERLARFRQEVRVARAVSHPNVCRVHDIGEHEGRPFLTMEYIDGEDLARSLRRIGSLPESRGIEIARQLLGGLAAIHAKGLLHRDLKPANVMLDGNGEVKLTDFGLAVDAGRLGPEDARAGTPAYMAPEQLTGEEVTARSDIYAAGLILYEVFTGRRAYPPSDRAGLARMIQEGPPPPPSSLVTGLNPAIDTLILRCLEPVSSRRPASANEALAAAMAVGRIPSPREVADAVSVGRLRPSWAALYLLLTLAGIGLYACLNDYAALFRRVGLERDPEELASQARRLLVQFGYPEPSRRGDSAKGFVTDSTFLQDLRKSSQTAERWAEVVPTGPGRAPPMFFWYRTSSEPMVQRLNPSDILGFAMPGRVAPAEPPLREPGMTCQMLDPAGRLLEFHAVLGQRATPIPSLQEPDISALLNAAGIANWTPVPPLRRPRTFADDRRAWADSTGRLRAEAAFCSGQLVYFYMGPPHLPDRLALPAQPQSQGMRLFRELYVWVGMIALTAGAALAWRNWRTRRVDPHGALRVALVYAVWIIAAWGLLAEHVFSVPDELAVFVAMLGRVVLEAFIFWLAYLALEPYARRRHPWRLGGWICLLAGRWRDPLVGRDCLIGGAIGVASALMVQAQSLVPASMGLPYPLWGIWDASLTANTLGVLMGLLRPVANFSVMDFFLLFVLLLVLRREWLAVIVWFVVRTIPTAAHMAEAAWPGWGLAGVFMALHLLALLRFGLLAYLVCGYFAFVLMATPITYDFNQWYFTRGALAVLTLLAILGYGFVIALGGQRLLPDWFFGDD